MSAGSGIGKLIGSLLFMFFLSSAIFAGTAAVVTDYSNVKSAFTSIIADALGGSVSQSDLEFLRNEVVSQCGSSQTLEREFQGLGSIVIDCDGVKAGSVADFPGVIASSYLDTVYYRSYSCDFITCYNQAQGADKLAVIVSQHANSFFMTMMWIFAALTIVGLIIIAASVRHAFTILKVVGIDMVVSGLPGFFITSMKNFLPIEGAPSGVVSFLDSILSFLATTYIGIFGIGVILAVAGFVLASKWPPVKKSQSSQSSVRAKGPQRSFTPRFGTEAQFKKRGGHGVHYSREGQPYIKDKLGRVRFIRKSKKK